MSKPIFQKGKIVVEAHGGLKIEIPERQWKHIIQERNRRYFQNQFDKIAQTLSDPDRKIKSKKQKNVFIYERFFDDFYIQNTVLGHAYIYVVVNTKTERLNTAYADRSQQTKGMVVWQK